VANSIGIGNVDVEKYYEFLESRDAVREYARGPRSGQADRIVRLNGRSKNLPPEFVKEAGYPKGLTLKGHTGNTTINVSEAEAVKAMLATGLYHPEGTFNYGRNNNPKVLALIDRGRVELNMGKRQKIYWELEKVLYENYEDVWIYYPVSNTARSKRLMGFDPKSSLVGGEYYSFSHPSWFKDGRRE